MADASVHVLLNVDFKDIIGIEKYSSVFYGAKVDLLGSRSLSGSLRGILLHPNGSSLYLGDDCSHDQPAY